VAGRKRRFWSLKEKRIICRQASAPGVSVAQVALRYSLNANLLFKWLRDERFAPDDIDGSGPSFLPVEISKASAIEGPMTSVSAAPSVGCLRIELAGGHRIVAEGEFDGDALGRLLKGWLS